MPIAQRTADTVWEGRCPPAKAKYTPCSRAWSALSVTWASRTQCADGRTSPEELAAAAHASCFAMALAPRPGAHHIVRPRAQIGQQPPGASPLRSGTSELNRPTRVYEHA